jgi:hypothetical protein
MRKKSDKNDNNIDLMGRSRSRVPLERAGFSFLFVGTTPTCRLPLRLGLPCESTSAAPVDEFVLLVVVLKATGAMVRVSVTVVDGGGGGVAGSADGSSADGRSAAVVMGKEMGKEYGW